MESIPGLHEMLDRGELLKALRAFKRGDFSVRMPMNLTGMDGEIAEAFNDVVELEEAKAAEIARVAELVGKEGQMSHRMSVPGASGTWAEIVEALNGLIADMAYPVNEVARVIGSVARGDLSQTMVLDPGGVPLRGEALRLGTVVNRMVGELNGFAAEVTRVAREVGTEGKLGGQAQVEGAAGARNGEAASAEPVLADLLGGVDDLLRHGLVQLDHVVERLRDLAVDAGEAERHAHGEVAALEGAQGSEQLPAVEHHMEAWLDGFHRFLRRLNLGDRRGERSRGAIEERPARLSRFELQTPQSTRWWAMA